MPTMREIAGVVGFSSMTVSLALRDSPKISMETKKRIKAAAKSMGYLPDPQVAKLMQYLRSRTKPRYQSTLCAVSSVFAKEEGFYLREMLKGAETRARSLGYGFDVFRVCDAAKPSRSLQRTIRGRGIEGVMLAPMMSPVEEAALLDWNDLSVVATTYAVKRPSFHRIVPGQFSNMLDLCGRLIVAGYRRIGLAMPAIQDEVVHHHFSAAVVWRTMLSGSDFVPPLLYHSESFREVDDWYVAHKPDAVILGGEVDVRRFEERVCRRNRRSPLLVASAVDEGSGSSVPGMVERPADIGARAIELLAAMVQRGEKGVPAVPLVTMVEGYWLSRGKFARSPSRTSRVRASYGQTTL